MQYKEDNDTFELKPIKKTISVILEITKVTKKVPKIDLDEFKE